MHHPGSPIKALVLGLFVLGSSVAEADTIHLKSGGTLEGVILKRNEDGVVILLKYATVTVGSFDIESLEASREAPTGRLAGWERCYQAAAGRPWGADLTPLPSRLIDSGALKNVPYVVHASGNYQLAIYGDPERPAAIEVGLSGVGRNLEAVRKECVDLVASFMTRPGDVSALRALPLQPGKTECDGLVLETSDEPDSRGRESWWISVSIPSELDLARVSDKDLPRMINPEFPAPLSSPTLVQSSPGSGEKQEVITPFGTEPDNHKRRKTYGGGGRWSGHVRWNHGRPTVVKP